MRGLIFRYLRTRRIALLAVGAITLGVMAMIVILALMSGVQQFLVEHFRATQADIVIRHEDAAVDETAVRALLAGECGPGGRIAALAARDEVLALLVPGRVADAQAEERIEGVRIRGVDWQDELRVTPLTRMMDSVANAALTVPQAQRHAPLANGGILLGDALAVALGVTGPAGAGPHEVTVVVARATAGPDGKPVFDETRTAVVAIVGTLSSGHAEHDRTMALMDRAALRTLRGKPLAREADALHALVATGADASATAAQLRADHPELLVQSFMEAHRHELRAIDDQKRIMLVILSSVIAVAAVAILGMVWLMVKEKTRDIGILRSMGLARWRIVGLFCGYGVLLGAIGTGCGLLLGVLVALQIDPIIDGLSAVLGVDLLNPEVYRFESIPVRFESGAILTVVVIALGASFIASLIPALRAAAMDPVRCLRSE